jgi:hypothetical protein
MELCTKCYSMLQYCAPNDRRRDGRGVAVFVLETQVRKNEASGSASKNHPRSSWSQWSGLLHLPDIFETKAPVDYSFS